MRHNRFTITSILVALFANHAEGSSVYPLRLAELIEASPLIVRARAAKVDPVGNYDPTGRPCTMVQLEVLEVLKGSSGTKDVEYCALGGIEPDGRFSFPVGGPALIDGSTYLLFLNPSDWTVTPIVNWTNGAFREVPDRGRTIYASVGGAGVADLTINGFIMAGRVDEPEQVKLFRKHGIPLRSVHHEVADGKMVNDAPESTDDQASANAQKASAPKDHILSKIGSTMAELNVRVSEDEPQAFSKFSQALTPAVNEE